MGRYLRVYRVIGKTFGSWFKPLGAFALLQVRQAISATTLGLDHMFFPGHRKQSIDRPIFIIGNPAQRHHVSASAACWGPAIWPLWSCGRCCFPRSPRASCSAASCRGWTSSRRPATTRRTCTTRACAASKPTTWHGFSERWTDHLRGRISSPGGIPGEVRFPGATSGSTVCRPRRKTASSSTTTLCWRRNLTLKGANRILVKSSMLTFRLDALLRRYPDCRLVYVIRDPVEVIPSGMSLLASVLENGFDVWNRTNKEDQRQVAGKPLPGLGRHAARLP